jgi:hypothetical protein
MESKSDARAVRWQVHNEYVDDESGMKMSRVNSTLFKTKEDAIKRAIVNYMRDLLFRHQDYSRTSTEQGDKILAEANKIENLEKRLKFLTDKLAAGLEGAYFVHVAKDATKENLDRTNHAFAALEKGDWSVDSLVNFKHADLVAECREE